MAHWAGRAPFPELGEEHDEGLVSQPAAEPNVAAQPRAQDNDSATAAKEEEDRSLLRRSLRRLRYVSLSSLFGSLPLPSSYLFSDQLTRAPWSMRIPDNHGTNDNAASPPNDGQDIELQPIVGNVGNRQLIDQMGRSTSRWGRFYARFNVKYALILVLGPVCCTLLF